MPVEREDELPVCLVIGAPLLLLLTFLFCFELEDTGVAPPPLSLPLSFTLSLLADEVVGPLTAAAGGEGTNELAVDWEFLSSVCVCV